MAEYLNGYFNSVFPREDISSICQISKLAKLKNIYWISLLGLLLFQYYFPKRCDAYMQLQICKKKFF